MDDVLCGGTTPAGPALRGLCVTMILDHVEVVFSPNFVCLVAAPCWKYDEDWCGFVAAFFC